MRSVALLAVALLALAGCSGKPDPQPYTCQKTGTAIDLSGVEGSGREGFDPESACPAPLPPSVAFTAVPTTMAAYFPATVAWSIATGNYTSGHSMLNGLVLFHHPVADDQLAAPVAGAPTTLCTFAHQEVPAPFSCKVRFEKAGTYGLRAYAQVRGDGLADTDYWTPEVKVTVKPVDATGKATEATRAAGPALAGQGGTFTPTTVAASLGDALVLVNQDLVAHTFSFSGACRHDDVTVAASAGTDVRSDPVVMVVPGSCFVTTDDPQPQTLTLNVAEPA